MKSIQKIILIISVLASVVFGQNILQVDGGTIQGAMEEGVKVFKGIPYSAPPVGELRWQPPQPIIPWSGIRDASDYCLACPQLASDSASFWFRDPVEYDEDCLFLNVWTTAEPDEKQAVMVWIHGGAFLDGAGSYHDYSGLQLAKKGVVVVTINYRLNVLGFLAHPELTEESPNHTSGNYGLLDQIAALQWIQKNISKFGGDPDNVTIFGHSAGSMAMFGLISSPLAKGLFHKAIPQSGPPIKNLRHLKEKDSNNQSPENIGVEFAKRAGANTLKEFRMISDDDLMKEFKTWNKTGMPRFSPVIDGYVITDSYYETLLNGNINDIEIMVGTTSLEISPMVDSNTVPKTIQALYDVADRMLGNNSAEFKKLYSVQEDKEAQRAFLQFLTDRSWLFPLWEWMMNSTRKSPVYHYYFTYNVPHEKIDYYGAFHSAEVGYAFNNLNWSDKKYRETDKQLGEILSDLWVSFAKTGVPSAEGVAEWKPFDKENQFYLEIGDKIELRKHLKKDQMEFIQRISR